MKFAQSNCNQIDNKFKMKLTDKLIDCLVKPSKFIFLAGEWMLLDSQRKEELLAMMKEMKEQIPLKKSEMSGMITFAENPWSSSAVVNLINGKTENEGEVLGLLSNEGVEGVALRIEMLVESGMDNQALKAVSTVVLALISEMMILQSYVATSAPSIVDRLVDIFLVLSAKLNKDLRLLKVLKLIGIEDVNKICIPRLNRYMSQVPKENQDKKTESESTTDSKTETGEKSKKSDDNEMDTQEEEDDDDLEDRFQLLEKGRCEKLFTDANCQKALEIILQWSLASVAVQDTETKLQEQLIKLGKEVELQCLRLFIKSLTRDINEYEAVKRIKSSKTAMEEKLARAFWLLSDIIYDRTSLCRESVLTGFSIKPDKQALDRIIHLAHISGVDQTQADSDNEMDTETEIDKLENNKSGLHCRVTVGEEGEKKKFLKSYHQARKVKNNTQPIDHILTTFNQSLDTIPFQNLESELQERSFALVPTKLRTNKPREKRTRNLEGLISIRGELITEAANYNPLDKPCKSLDAGALNLPPALTDDLLIVISAPRWHMLTWVMAWPDLLKACKNLLENPKLREPTEDLKYLNIDYTQFNGWSSDEEVTIYTGIEKGYEQWVLEGPDDNEDKVVESEASSEEDAEHTINWEDYDDTDKYLVPEDYNPEAKRNPAEAIVLRDETKLEEESDKEEEKKDQKEKKEKPSRKRKLEEKISENVQDEFCNEEEN